MPIQAMQPEQLFPSLYPLENEEEEAQQLCSHLQRFFAPNWKSTTKWIDSPLKLLLCCADQKQAHLLPRAFAMEIANNLAWRSDSIKYASPDKLQELKTSLNLYGTIKSLVPGIRSTLIIRDLKAFYDSFKKDPLAKQQLFDAYLIEISKTRNIIAGIHESDLDQMPCTDFFDLNDSRLMEGLFKGISIKVNLDYGAFVIPPVTNRDLILRQLFLKLNDKSFVGFYSSNTYGAILEYDKGQSLEQINKDLKHFSDEQLNYAVNGLELLIKEGYRYTYIISAEYVDLIQKLWEKFYDKDKIPPTKVIKHQ